MNQQQVDKLLSKLKGTLSYDDFKTVDMVVEAVIESIDLKQKIFAGGLAVLHAGPQIFSPQASLCDSQRPTHAENGKVTVRQRVACML